MIMDYIFGYEIFSPKILHFFELLHQKRFYVFYSIREMQILTIYFIVVRDFQLQSKLIFGFS